MSIKSPCLIKSSTNHIQLEFSTWFDIIDQRSYRLVRPSLLALEKRKIPYASVPIDPSRLPSLGVDGRIEVVLIAFFPSFPGSQAKPHTHHLQMTITTHGSYITLSVTYNLFCFVPCSQFSSFKAPLLTQYFRFRFEDTPTPHVVWERQHPHDPTPMSPPSRSYSLKERIQHGMLMRGRVSFLSASQFTSFKAASHHAVIFPFDLTTPQHHLMWGKTATPISPPSRPRRSQGTDLIRQDVDEGQRQTDGVWPHDVRSWATEISAPCRPLSPAYSRRGIAQ